MDVKLRQIDRHHKEEFVGANVSEELERFMARNLDTIAGHGPNTEFIPYAVLNHEGRTVGFIMVGSREEEGHYWLAKLMIDSCERRKGYGSAALQKAIGLLRASPGCRSVVVSYAPGNAAAKGLLEHLGFVSTGEQKEGELLARLVFND